MAELRVVTALVAKRAEMIKADKEQEEPDGEKNKTSRETGEAGRQIVI